MGKTGVSKKPAAVGASSQTTDKPKKKRQVLKKPSIKVKSGGARTELDRVALHFNRQMPKDLQDQPRCKLKKFQAKTVRVATMMSGSEVHQFYCSAILLFVDVLVVGFHCCSLVLLL